MVSTVIRRGSPALVAVAVAARPAPSVLDQATLPYSGSSAQTLIIFGAVLLAAGLVVLESGRSSRDPV